MYTLSLATIKSCAIVLVGQNSIAEQKIKFKDAQVNLSIDATFLETKGSRSPFK
jgi:hypothetical protein